MWFDLTEKDRNIWNWHQCATSDCSGTPTSRLEADEVGSNYCAHCRWRIERLERSSRESNAQIDELEAIFGKIE